VTPAGVVQTSAEEIRVDVTGGFHSEADLKNVNFVANGQIFRLSDIATIKRTYSDPPQPMFRFEGQPAIGIGISMRAGGDVLALGKNIEQAMSEIKADLPVGIEPHLAADQPKVVKAAVDDFMEALWEAIGIVLAVSFISLGVRAGAVVACSIPLVLAAVFVGMAFAGIDLQRVSLGALIIALGLLVDDAMITVETMVTQLEAGAEKTKAATFAYTSTAFPMLTGTLVTVAGFVPIGFAKRFCRRIHVFAFCGRCIGARDFLDRRGSVRASDRRNHPARQDEAHGGCGARPNPPGLSPCVDGSDARQMVHDRSDARGIGGFDTWIALPSTVFSGVRPAGTARRPETLGGLLPLCNAEGRYSRRRTPERRPRY
jgi:hypothetical protein